MNQTARIMYHGRQWSQRAKRMTQGWCWYRFIVQYSSGKRMQVEFRSASVMTQILTPFMVV